MLLLDDVHWADDGSLELIAHHGRRPAAAPVLVAVAARTAQTLGALDAVLDGAERDGRCRRILLEPLRTADADLLLGRRSPAAAAEPSSARAAATPSTCSSWPSSATSSKCPRRSCRAVQRELTPLAEATRLVAAAAAVVGDPFAPTSSQQPPTRRFPRRRRRSTASPRST